MTKRPITNIGDGNEQPPLKRSAPNKDEEEQTLFVPLAFFFARDPGIALPLAALPYNDVKIDFQLLDWQELIPNVCGSSEPSRKRPPNNDCEEEPPLKRSAPNEDEEPLRKRSPSNDCDEQPPLKRFAPNSRNN